MTWNEQPGRKRGTAAIVLLSLGAVLVAGAALWAAFGAPQGHQSIVVRGDGMMPTHARGDQVPFFIPPAGDVERGEVVFANVPWGNGGDAPFRVVAVGGDHLVFTPGTSRLVLNERPLDEPYLMDRAVPATLPFDVVVPEGRIFLMGDNRADSDDSSHHVTGTTEGMVPLSAVHAKPVTDPDAAVDIRPVLLFAALPLLAGAALGTSALLARRRAPKTAAAVAVTKSSTAT
ncbi:signal peptidase I [Streptomyces sp. NBC_00503]|uniref:signal peptidase I n=1 Tax=Streptomyces sp. NBC_00503 TaxID=2903659 RepID=UPI002E80769B|nr:signal peptidase I [Streptomyces sp. NBC_00503]WUD82479.1 signal peptidase I [Streptomyces sp. NBC_00503]